LAQDAGALRRPSRPAVRVAEVAVAFSSAEPGPRWHAQRRIPSVNDVEHVLDYQRQRQLVEWVGLCVRSGVGAGPNQIPVGKPEFLEQQVKGRRQRDVPRRPRPIENRFGPPDTNLQLARSGQAIPLTAAKRSGFVSQNVRA